MIYDDEIKPDDEEMEYYRALYQAHKRKTPTEQYHEWIMAQDFLIGNGDMLLEISENPAIRSQYCAEMGISEDIEL
jgi:hypothetical protein